MRKSEKAQRVARGTWQGRLCGLAFAVILLCVLELFFRIVGFGGLPNLVTEIGDVNGRTLVEVEPRAMQSYFFGSVPGRGSGRKTSFYHPKSPRETRIVLAGESAILGFPQPKPLTAASFLEWGLERAWPGSDVTVINLGTTAVASFPVYDMVRQILPYDPDLVVVYTGNNEFYGSYGVCSTHYAGRHPAFMRVMRTLQALGIVQWLNRQILNTREERTEILMERMMAERRVPADSGLRRRAAENLSYHVKRIIQDCSERGIPVMVCTLAVNEKDMAPIGSDPWDDADDPDTASAHYRAARDLTREGRYAEALFEYRAAVDTDPMPWRATSDLNAALARAAGENGAMLCDVAETFRSLVPGRAIGWELMDDHVHFSLAGQYALALSIIKTLVEYPGALSVREADFRKLPNWEVAARYLGSNVYEQYAAAHAMSEIFNTDFMARSNPGALKMMQARLQKLKAEMEPSIAGKFVEVIHARGGKFAEFHSASGTAAEMLLRAGKIEAAVPLLDFACRSLPEYSKYRRANAAMKYACMKKLGMLTADNEGAIEDEITHGEILLKYGVDPSGITEFALSKLCALIGREDDANRYRMLSAAKDPGLPNVWPMQ